MLRFSTLVFATIALILPAGATRAQQGAPLSPGDRVRVSHGCEMTPRGMAKVWQCSREVGRVARVTADSLHLERDDGRSLQIALPRVSQLERETGTRSRWKEGAAIGLVAGAVIGAFAAVAEYEPCQPGTLGCVFGDPGPGVHAFAGAIVGGGLGAGLGLAIGAALPTRRWETIHVGRLLVSAAPYPGRLAVAWSIPLR